MQIWKSPHMFVPMYKNNNLKIFAFLILRVFKLFAREICKFLKK